jgi:hypothetical protein
MKCLSLALALSHFLNSLPLLSERVLEPTMFLNRHASQAVSTLVTEPGVWLLCGSRGSGKTTTVRQVATQLRVQQRRPVAFVSGSQFDSSVHVSVRWLQSQLGTQTQTGSQHGLLHGLLRQDTVVIVDNADAVLSHPQGQQFVVGLAVEAVNSRKFSVLITLRDPELAGRAASWNNYKKIHAFSPSLLQVKQGEALYNIWLRANWSETTTRIVGTLASELPMETFAPKLADTEEKIIRQLPALIEQAQQWRIIMENFTLMVCVSPLSFCYRNSN